MKMLAKDSKYIDDAPDRVSMFYKLLMASTTDRLGMLMKSDSDLINVEKYYEYTKSSDKLIRTYFLIGRINENNGHITKAMLYYQKAADEAGRANMYEVMAEAQNHYIGLMLDGKIPRDSIPSYIKTYKRKAEQIYSERNKLQQDTQTEALVIIVCIIIMIALAIFIVHKHKKEKGKVSSNDLIDRTLNKTPIEGTMKDVTKTSGYPISTEIRKKASQPDFKLPETSWNNFFDEIDDQYADMCTRLREKLPRISDIELMTCCLTKLGIRNSDMAHLLCRSDNSVSSIRSRLYEK